MIVFKAYLGDSRTADSIRSLLGSSDLVPIDSWSEINLTYEKYESEDFRRSWDKIVKDPSGLQSLDKVPADGTLGLLYET
jgi:hypothetical protein